VKETGENIAESEAAKICEAQQSVMKAKISAKTSKKRKRYKWKIINQYGVSS